MATIDLVGEDILLNIIARLPALSFASAACVNRSWNLVCSCVLCRPKLSSACSYNPSLQDAVEEMVTKVLSEPIRPHFAIASVGPLFDLQEAHQLITEKIGSKVILVSHRPSGIIGRNVLYDEFKETRWKLTEDDDEDYDNDFDDEIANRGIMLIVGFLPGIKVGKVPLVNKPLGFSFETTRFLRDFMEFSTSISGCGSPAAILMFGLLPGVEAGDARKLMDYLISPETVIVGDYDNEFEEVCAVALVFVKDPNKASGIGEIKFHTALSSGLLPVGTVYTASILEQYKGVTDLTARREGSAENLFAGGVFRQEYEELRDLIYDGHVFVGITKGRPGQVTSLAFPRVCRFTEEYFRVLYKDIRTGDAFRFYKLDSTTALSSIANVSNHLRSFKQEVFGGLMFTSRERGGTFFSQPNIDSSPFLDNFPGVTFAGIFSRKDFGRGDFIPYAKESEKQKSVQ
ncbi:F-box/LRR-repeat protein At5g63520-like [Bidens hawaiensis]|uniref:F-box/LRR-repeat protein At5g63520-like n=1 Tax=Bidens hawaiensis TaxID=980011 RepID=UPI00404BA09D